MPELTYTLQGMKAEIDATVRYSGKLQHKVTASIGYTTSLKLEATLPEHLVEEMQDEYTGIIA